MNYHAVEDHIFVGPVRPGYAYRCRVAAFTVGQGPFTDYFIVTSQELGISVMNECRRVVIFCEIKNATIKFLTQHLSL